MKRKFDKVIWTVLLGGMYGYSFVNLDCASFCSGVIVGIATVIVATVWYDS